MLKNWLLIGGVVAVIVGIAFFSLPEPVGKVREGDMAPDYTLTDMAGLQQSLPRGKVVLLNFWATWCPPCRDEMPSMVELHKRLHAGGLEIVAASVDKDMGKLNSFVREYGLPFQVLKDMDKVVSLGYGVVRYPETFLIDRTGKVRFHLIGAVNWTDPTVLKAIQTMLAEKPQV